MDILKFLSDPMFILIGSNVIIFIIGWFLPDAQIKSVATKASQFMRLRFGKKFEDKVENVVSVFNEGLKADNEEDKKNMQK